MSERRPPLPPSWSEPLEREFSADYMQALSAFLREEKRQFNVFPPGAELFAALEQTPLNRVRVVILGQDPYHGAGQAHGLCFSVRRGVQIPPSLKNIYAELKTDLGLSPPAHGNLERWAEQGVLLLNTVLSVRENAALSHRGKGWERFTDRVVALVNEQPAVAFVLWGRPAQEKAARIDMNRHFVVRSPHPSPLSAYGGFFGSRPFSRVNEWLRSRGEPEIDWSLG